jgi:hypothetical protein
VEFLSSGYRVGMKRKELELAEAAADSVLDGGRA